MLIDIGSRVNDSLQMHLHSKSGYFDRKYFLGFIVFRVCAKSL